MQMLLAACVFVWLLSVVAAKVRSQEAVSQLVSHVTPEPCVLLHLRAEQTVRDVDELSAEHERAAFEMPRLRILQHLRSSRPTEKAAECQAAERISSRTSRMDPWLAINPV